MCSLIHPCWQSASKTRFNACLNKTSQITYVKSGCYLTFLGDMHGVRLFAKNEWQLVCVYVCNIADGVGCQTVYAEGNWWEFICITLLHLNSMHNLTVISISYMHLSIGRCVAWAAFSCKKNGAKRLLNGNSGALNTLFWWRKCCKYGSWEGHSFCSFWIIFWAWWNRYKYVFNTAKYTLLQSLPLLSRIKENIPIEWRDLWKLIIVIQHLPRILGWKEKYYRCRIIHFLPLCYVDCVMMYMTLLFWLWVLGLSLLLITVVVLWYCNIYHYIFRGA